jgi:hypothetical protein
MSATEPGGRGGVETRRGRKIAFASLDDANSWRDDHPEALHPDDTRRTKTVTLHPDVSDEIQESAERAAEMSKAGVRKQYGQEPLTDDEKAQLKDRPAFSWQEHAFEARAVKAALQEEGVVDWLNYYEPGGKGGDTLELVERAKEMQARTRAPTGLGGERVDSDPNPGADGRELERTEGIRENRAEAAARNGDADAARTLLEDFGWSQADVRELFPGDVPDGTPESEPEPEPEPESDGSTETEQATITEPEPDPEPEPEPAPELPLPTLAGIMLAAGLRTLLTGAWRAVRWLAPRLAGATKRTAYAAGVAVGWGVRATVALALVVLASCYRFGEGFGRAVVGGGSV